MLKYLAPVLILTAIVNCTINFIKDDELKSLDKQYEGIYSVKADINTGNDSILKTGSRVRLYFLSGASSLKVYAYDVDESRETAIGKNVLYLFESDFPDSKFEKLVLDKKINELLKKIN